MGYWSFAAWSRNNLCSLLMWRPADALGVGGVDDAVVGLCITEMSDLRLKPSQ